MNTRRTHGCWTLDWGHGGTAQVRMCSMPGVVLWCGVVSWACTEVTDGVSSAQALWAESGAVSRASAPAPALMAARRRLVWWGGFGASWLEIGAAAVS